MTSCGLDEAVTNAARKLEYVQKLSKIPHKQYCIVDGRYDSTELKYARDVSTVEEAVSCVREVCSYLFSFSNKDNSQTIRIYSVKKFRQPIESWLNSQGKTWINNLFNVVEPKKG